MNKVNFSILIDYAHEPESLSQFLQTLASWRQNGYFDLVIHILSCDGLGRDDWKKPIMGSLSYKYVDFTILTTDNYGEKDNPQEIVELLGKDFIDRDELLSKEWLDYHLNLEFDEEKEFKKTKKVKFLLEIDRKIAMKKSLQIAQFLVSNYDYLFLKKSNLQLTKGKINSKNLLPNIAKESKWNQKPITKENKENYTTLGQKKEKLEDLKIDLEDIENYKNTERQKESLELKAKNLDQKQQIEDILDEDYLEILENKQDILSSNKDLKDTLENENETKLESDNLLEKNSDLEQNLRKKEEEKQEVEQNLDKELKVLIVSTGVGCEPFLSQPGENLEWNEKEIWQEIWVEFYKTLQK